ncbi:MAG: Ppx/GppA family phosphatase [Sinobacteraceae bacterium]|nr:Ppx/GppA family phosphatase [Nevskiaceae bacterium]
MKPEPACSRTERHAAASRHAQPTRRTIAAVDLGSNSFHLLVARTDGMQLQVVDRLKEPVRLAAGLDAQQRLSAAACARALACLERFGQRLRRFPAVQVRAVGTYTLRRAYPVVPFLEQAQQALGHPIEVISGIEEARLIYAGVTLDFDTEQPRRLVIDIGGGSTEIILGQLTEPRLMESLPLGAVVYSQRFFPRGVITASAWHQAVVAARLELEPMAHAYRSAGWDTVVGASGSIKTIQQVCMDYGWIDDAITPAALNKLASRLVKAGSVDNAKLPKLSASRRTVLAGATAILSASFDALGIDAMQATDKALREGLLLNIIGANHSHDLRRISVADAQRRYSVDVAHAQRVATTAQQLLDDAAGWLPTTTDWGGVLHWVCQLHEIGLAIAHKGYHKHGAYILRNADLHGFSQSEQAVLATLLRLQRGKFRKTEVADLPSNQQAVVERIAVLLRLAVLLHRSRVPAQLPRCRLEVNNTTLKLTFGDGWLETHPLTRAELEREQTNLASAGYDLQIL